MDRWRAQVLALQRDARHRDGDQEPIEERQGNSSGGGNSRGGENTFRPHWRN